MLFLLASLAAAATAPIVIRTPEPAAAAKRCALPEVTYALQTTRSHSDVRRLSEEPPATQYLAVARNVGGCPAPAIVRMGIGK